MKFRYIQAGLWHRPIIPVVLRYKGKEISYLALIDSGADFNIFHKDIADILGINLSKLKKVSFAGISASSKKSEGSFVEVELDVGGMMTKTLVLFSKDISDDGYGILGEQGFFNNFIVTFNYPKKEIEVTPHTLGKQRN